MVKKLRGNLNVLNVNAILQIFVSKIIIIVLGFASNVLIVRTIGLEGVGSVSVFLAFMGLISALSHLGLPVSNIYYLSRVKDKTILLSNSLLFIFLIAFISTILVYIFEPFIQKTYLENLSPFFIYVIFIGLLLSLTKVFYSTFLRALERFKEFSKASILEQLSRVGLIFVVYTFFDLTADIIIILTYVSIIIANSYRIYIIKNDIRFTLKSYDLNQFIISIKYGLKDFTGSAANTLTTQIDLIVLAFIVTKEDIGLIVIATALAKIIQYGSDSIGSVILSQIANSKDKKKSLKIMAVSVVLNTGVGLLFLLLLYFSGRYLIEVIYKIPSEVAFELTLLYALGLILFGNVLIAAKFISGLGYPWQKSLVRIYSLPFKLISLYVLATEYGILGAAYSYLATTLVMLLISIYFIKKILASKDEY